MKQFAYIQVSLFRLFINLYVKPINLRIYGLRTDFTKEKFNLFFPSAYDSLITVLNNPDIFYMQIQDHHVKIYKKH